MGICGDASKWAKIAALLEIIGLPLFLSGYATPAWMVSETIRELVDLYIGLWKSNDCSSGSCQLQSVPDSFKSGSFVATQIIESLSLVGYVFSTVFITIYVATEKARTRCFAVTIMTFGFTATFFCILGMIIWMTQLPTNYFASWSLGLTIVGAALYVVGSCLLIKELREQKKKNANVLKVEPRKQEIETTYFREPLPLPSPRYEKRALPPPSPPIRYEKRPLPSDSPQYFPISPRTPRSLRIDVISPVYSDRTRSTRRYGTPTATQRYDFKAR